MTTMEEGVGGDRWRGRAGAAAMGGASGAAPLVAASMWLCAVGVPLDADSANA